MAGRHRRLVVRLASAGIVGIETRRDLRQRFSAIGSRRSGSRPTSRSPGCSEVGSCPRGSRSTSLGLSSGSMHKGQPITRIPVAPPTRGQGTGRPRADFSLPEIITKDGELTLEQDGRKPMKIRGVEARLSPVEDGGKTCRQDRRPQLGPDHRRRPF